MNKNIKVLIISILAVFGLIAIIYNYSYAAEMTVNSLESTESTASVNYYSFQTDSSSFFKDYQSWPSSSQVYYGDNTMVLINSLLLLNADHNNPDIGHSASTMADIDGNGMADILFISTLPSSMNNSNQYLVLLNQGSNNYSVGYKCFYKDRVYYGDCALPANGVGDGSTLPTNKGAGSTNYRTADLTYQMLKYQAVGQRSISNISADTSNYVVNYNDVNSDGLADFTYIKDDINSSGVYPVYYYIMAVFINQGNLKFQRSYWCDATVNETSGWYYGDCAM